MKRLVIINIFIVGILTLGFSPALAVTLGFDDLTPGTNIINTTYQGIYFSSPTNNIIEVIQDNTYGAGWSSSSNSISTDGSNIWMGTIKADFLLPTFSVGITGGDQGGDQDSFTMELYDSSDTLLASLLSGLFGGNPSSTNGMFGDSYTLFYGTRAGDIDYALFIPTSPSGLGISFDDLTYTPVPEPSTFLLLGGGLAGLAFVARRRKKE